MRRLRITLAAAAIAAFVGTSTGASSASAQEVAPAGITQLGSAAADRNCAQTLAWLPANGNVYVYSGYGCAGSAMCKDDGNELAYGDTSGECTGSDDDSASSAINNGYSGDDEVVKFYSKAGYDGGHICLAVQDTVASLYNYDFTGGIPVDNNITSHKWVDPGDCDRWL